MDAVGPGSVVKCQVGALARVQEVPQALGERGHVRAGAIRVQDQVFLEFEDGVILAQPVENVVGAI